MFLVLIIKHMVLLDCTASHTNPRTQEFWIMDCINKISL